ncbi:MAG TPA: outer membrane beta-barrel protein [Candidatus Eisenbacteria bacterium]|nr:outer membrane beta-barrel protein [Candidatus Eisenbacteria bacterium]
MARTLAKGLIALLMLASPSLARAQTPTPTDATAPATPVAKPRIVYESLVGYGAVGFQGGVPIFVADSDVSANATPRLSGDLSFSYVWDDNLVGDLNIGYAWNRLGDDPERWMIQTVPITLGARYVMKRQSRNRPYVGAGAGAYIWAIQTKDLGAAKDDITFERYRRADFGFYGTAGLERRLSNTLTGSADAAYHYIMSEDTHDFPSGFNGNKAYVQFRLGLKFYFSLSERLDQGLPE